MFQSHPDFNQTRTWFQLREYAYDIHAKYDSGASDAEVQDLISEQMSTIFRFVLAQVQPVIGSFVWKPFL